MGTHKTAFRSYWLLCNLNLDVHATLRVSDEIICNIVLSHGRASVSKDLDKVWREYRPVLEPEDIAAGKDASTTDCEDTAAGEPPFPRMNCRLDDFEVLDVLGKGSFGTVSRCVCTLRLSFNGLRSAQK